MGSCKSKLKQTQSKDPTKEIKGTNFRSTNYTLGADQNKSEVEKKEIESVRINLFMNKEENRSREDESEGGKRKTMLESEPYGKQSIIAIDLDDG